MRSLIFIGVLLLTAPLFAAHSPQALLGPCFEEFKSEISYIKEDFLKSSPWNYDNDYWIEDVGVSALYDQTPTSFKVDLYLTADPGLKEVSRSSYQFSFKVNGSTCESLRYYWFD